MKTKYSSMNLIEIDKLLSQTVSQVTLTGTDLALPEILSVANKNATTKFTNDRKIIEKLNTCYEHMLDQVKEGIPIYGCNTGYGARAEKVLNQGDPDTRVAISRQISESIVHTDISVGPELSISVVRAAILIRLNMLINGVSAVRIEDLEIFREMLNKGVTPIVNAYGGLGASGDLAHNSRVLSAARQLSGIKVRDANNKVGDARRVLQSLNIKPLVLQPKAGLGLVNGDNFSTAAAALIVSELVNLILVADVLGAMVIEVLKGSNRTFHPFLSKIRPHPGLMELSQLYRYLLSDSKLVYQEMTGHKVRPVGMKVQDAYSLRCLTQSEGLMREQIKWALDTIMVNANSVSDNPLWVSPEYVTPHEKPWQWVSGGNFFAGHMGEALDIIRKIITRLIKRNDRHLHRMVSPHESNGLPPNLSDSHALSSCTFKGVQLQSGMFDVYSMLLAQPVTTMFGIHEESNQDITPHALTSAILAWENIRLLKYSLAMNFLAVAQATDLRGGVQLLSSKTRPVYQYIRKKSAYIVKERPLAEDIEKVAQGIADGTLSEIIRTRVLKGFPN